MTLAALMAVKPQVRAYFKSGHTGWYTQDDRLRAGATRLFAKPFNVPKILEGPLA
jgi:hypothetical protein